MDGLPGAGHTPQIAVLDAPSNLGLRPPRPGAQPGVRKLPEVLRSAGLVRRIGAVDAGGLQVPVYGADPDPVTGFRNGRAISTFTRELADRIGQLLEQGMFPVVLGGDCSIVLGGMLALRRRGRHGLVFVDAHDDYSLVRDSARYAGRLTAAGLDLALATGHGPDDLADLDGLRPYVREEDVVHVGLSREPAESEQFRTETFDTSAVRTHRIDSIRASGMTGVAAETRQFMESASLDGFWIHVDADVLDEKIMPAVDSPNPDGLSFAELTELLATLLASPRARGLQVTIYDPERDPDGSAGAGLTDAIVAAFAHCRS